MRVPIFLPRREWAPLEKLTAFVEHTLPRNPDTRWRFLGGVGRYGIVLVRGGKKRGPSAADDPEAIAEARPPCIYHGNMTEDFTPDSVRCTTCGRTYRKAGRP